MFSFMPQSSGNRLGIQATGKLTHQDYAGTLIPKLGEFLAAHDKVRMMLYADPGFRGWELRAAWDDAAWGLKHAKQFEKIAVVGGPKWLEWATRLEAPFLAAEVQVFKADELEPAWQWLES